MIHCRMLDSTAQLQQEALGILGVNLVHGALSKGGNHYQVLAGLMDDLGRSRIEVKPSILDKFAKKSSNAAARIY